MRWRESSDWPWRSYSSSEPDSIGGSFALAMRRAGRFRTFAGHDTDAARRSGCVAARHIDAVARGSGCRDRGGRRGARCGTDCRDCGRSCGGSSRCVERGRPYSTSGASKAACSRRCAAAATCRACFVPSHPMAGSEQRGPAAADATLFRDRPVILTPQPETDPQALALVREWWGAAGATRHRNERADSR